MDVFKSNCLTDSTMVGVSSTSFNIVGRSMLDVFYGVGSSLSYLCHFKAHSNSLQSGSHSLIFDSLTRYSYLLDWRQENSSVERLGIIGYMTRLIRKPRRPASFFAYFRPDFPEILRLICCHTHLTHAVIQDLENRDVIYADGSSKQDMIPGEDKAFVFVSGGICPFDDEDVDDVYLR